VFKRQAFALAAALAIASASLAADVTIVMTMTMEGKAPGMAGQEMPRTVTHIKGLKSATVVEMGGNEMVNITDAANRRVVMLNRQQRTATVFDAATGKTGTGKSAAPSGLDIKITPTGRKRTINGIECSEHTFTANVRVDEMMGGAETPPEMAAMLQGVSMKLDGSIWSAPTGPGAADYMAFMKAAVDRNVLGLMANAMPGLSGGLNQMMAAMAKAPGIPYLTETAMTVEGTGPMVEVMRQMGMTMMRMEVTSVTTDPIADSMFEIPEGYKITK
jgi:hypothetical protein